MGGMAGIFNMFQSEANFFDGIIVGDALGVSVALVLGFGVYPTPLLTWARTAASLL